MQVILWTLFVLSPAVADVQPLWAFVEEPGGPIYARPSIAKDGTIYVGSDDQHVYGLHPNGTKKWKFQTGGQVRAGPIVEQDGTIYVCSDALYALWPDGTQKWKFETRSMSGFFHMQEPAVGDDGTIYITDGYLKAVNPNGTLKWKLESTSVIKSGVAIGADGTIYAGAGCSDYGPRVDPKEAHLCSEHEEPHYFLYSVTPAGKVNWKLNVGKRGFYVGGIEFPPAIGVDGTIYAAVGGNGVLFAVHPSGTVKWQYNINKHRDASLDNAPTVTADGTIYVGGTDSGTVLLSINAHGKEQWRFATSRGGYDATLWSSPVVGPDGTIYVGSADYKLYAITPKGHESWHFETWGQIWSTPAVGKDGTVYVGSLDRYFYALSASPAPAPPSPPHVPRSCWQCLFDDRDPPGEWVCVRTYNSCWADGTCHSKDQGWSPKDPGPKDKNSCQYNSTQGDYCRSICKSAMSTIKFV